MRTSVSIPIVHKITALYKNIYILNGKVPKRDKFGLHLRIEHECLDLLSLSIQAALESKEKKIDTLQRVRIKVEYIKHLVRVSEEMKIMSPEMYLTIQGQLQEISKMATGWLKFTT